MKACFLLSLLIVLGMTSHSGSAQSVYRWVDDEGKVHYGDRPPQSNAVEDISDDVQTINVDTSSDERKKMSKIFAKETDAEKRMHEQGRQQQQSAQQRRHLACKDAQEKLKVYLDKRFYLVDEEGKGHDVSKAQRERLIAEQREFIRRNCR